MAKRQYDREFKLNAVSLVVDQGLPLTRVRQDLGIGLSTLQRWVGELRSQGKHQAFPGTGRCNPEEERLRKLERENDVLRRERDILKKALAIFSSQ